MIDYFWQLQTNPVYSTDYNFDISVSNIFMDADSNCHILKLLSIIVKFKV